MRMTSAERQTRHRLKKYAEYSALIPIPCACGCGTLIPPINKQGKPARYAHGHNPDGIATQFKNGQISWNKGRSGLLATSHNLRNKKLTKETIKKRTATRLENNNGVYSTKSGWKHKPMTIALMTLKNRDKALRGEDNPAWLGGKSLEKYGTEFNKELKESIILRDSGVCVTCGQGANTIRLIVHHKDTDKMNNNPANLETLCVSCHARLHGKVLQNLRVKSEVM